MSNVFQRQKNVKTWAIISLIYSMAFGPQVTANSSLTFGPGDTLSKVIFCVAIAAEILIATINKNVLKFLRLFTEIVFLSSSHLETKILVSLTHWSSYG